MPIRSSWTWWSAAWSRNELPRAFRPAHLILLTFSPCAFIGICSRISTTGPVKSEPSRSAKALSNFSSGNTFRNVRRAPRLVRARFLIQLSRSDFAQQAAVIIGDVNYIHPFREGNGRTQLQYLKLLSERAGHPLDLARLDNTRWVEASQASHAADYALVAQLIEARSPGSGLLTPPPAGAGRAPGSSAVPPARGCRSAWSRCRRGRAASAPRADRRRSAGGGWRRHGAARAG